MLPSDRPITIFFLVKAVALAKSVHIVYTNYQIWIIDITMENREKGEDGGGGTLKAWFPK